MRCAYCGDLCRGHGYGEKPLEIHHIKPQALGGPSTRMNAVGLCGHADGCHCKFDSLYFEKGKTFTEVMMAEGRQYELKRWGLIPLKASQRSAAD